QLQQIYLIGSKKHFNISPDLNKRAPFYKTQDKPKTGKGAGPGRVSLLAQEVGARGGGAAMGRGRILQHSK
uniref:Uncharacterized protein n=1 Tax=Macaca fascicularis TaxID=9541 RepID=A0A7N9D609_MACFA